MATGQTRPIRRSRASATSFLYPASSSSRKRRIILEAGFERLHGVDFRKGCYVGQEVTARMKHKTELKKGLVRVPVEGEAPAGTPIEAAGRQAGTLFSQSDGQGIAHLRFGRSEEDMTAGAARVLWNDQARSE